MTGTSANWRLPMELARDVATPGGNAIECIEIIVGTHVGNTKMAIENSSGFN